MTPAPIDLDDLLEQSRQATGLHDFGGDDLFESLRVLTAALNNEAHLTPEGAAGKRAALLRGLGNRLKIVQALKDQPAIADEKIAGPLVIVGLPRSGTTKLHRIIAADPTMQSLPLWKILNPLPLGETPPGQKDPRIGVAEAFEAAMRETQPALHAAHPMLAREPDEDVFALEFTGRGYINCSAFRTPSYQAWLDAQNFEEWYAWLGRLLQVIQYFDHGAGRPWVLKAPQHLGFLPLLFARFPNATVIHCHRDPQICIASFATMLLAARRSTSSQVDVKEVGQYAVHFYEKLMQRYLQDRAPLESTHRFIDISYDDIVHHGVQTVRQIYRAASLEMTEDAAAAIHAWETANSQHKNGRHSYHLADAGLTHDDVSQAFAPYSARFAKYLS
jgi:hypothetical protein